MFCDFPVLTCVVDFREAILIDLKRKIRALGNITNANNGHRRGMRYSAPNSVFRSMESLGKINRMYGVRGLFKYAWRLSNPEVVDKASTGSRI